eukprot:2292247-Amphidinium_carterae.1
MNYSPHQGWCTGRARIAPPESTSGFQVCLIRCHGPRKYCVMSHLLKCGEHVGCFFAKYCSSQFVDIGSNVVLAASLLLLATGQRLGFAQGVVPKVAPLLIEWWWGKKAICA